METHEKRRVAVDLDEPGPCLPADRSAQVQSLDHRCRAKVELADEPCLTILSSAGVARYQVLQGAGKRLHELFVVIPVVVRG